MPYTYQDATGYRYYLCRKRTVGPDGQVYLSVYFTRTPTRAAVEVLEALPAGYQVVVQPHTGRPYVRKVPGVK